MCVESRNQSLVSIAHLDEPRRRRVCLSVFNTLFGSFVQRGLRKNPGPTVVPRLERKTADRPLDMSMSMRRTT
eukprot:438597-Pleurochrysis_carterae.AAC.2